MKAVFEAETEIGPCDPDRIDADFGENPGKWLAVGQTTVAMTGPKGMLRIEQSCYLRSADEPEDVRPQSWLRADISFEPVLETKEETNQFLAHLHEQFIQRARNILFERSLILDAVA